MSVTAGRAGSETAERAGSETAERAAPDAETACGPRWLDPSEAAAWRAYINGSQRLLGTLNRELTAAHGLSLDDYRILVELSESPGGVLRMSELADGIVSSRSRLTHQVRRLEDTDHVRRQECPDDGRGVLAVITPHGRSVLERIAPFHLESVRRHFVDHLSPAEQQVLADVFSRVDAAIAGS